MSELAKVIPLNAKWHGDEPSAPENQDLPEPECLVCFDDYAVECWDCTDGTDEDDSPCMTCDGEQYLPCPERCAPAQGKSTR